MSIKKNVLLAPYTTFGIGGSARYFTSVISEEELGEAVEFARKENLRIFVLGGGSNILISDQGFDGLVIHNQIKGIDDTRHGGITYLSCGAGERWDDVVLAAVSKGLPGLELLSGIPGTIGAAPVQNIGAYGASIDSVLYEVRAYDREIGDFRIFAKGECQFDYRSSIFKKEKNRYIITRVTLCFTGGIPIVPSYPDFKEEFSKNSRPSSMEIRNAVIRIRAQKGMLLLAGYESYKSAGSFFQNPVISKKEFETLKILADAQGQAWYCRAPWRWELPDNQVKVSAACLIQQAGFSKGYREGEVGLSPRHTLAVVNYGTASARDILVFAEKISQEVYTHFGVTLQPEVQVVGSVDRSAQVM